MRTGWMVLALAAGCAFGVSGVPSIPAKLLVGNLALCFALLGAAFLSRRPALLGKRVDGTLSPLAFPVFWPYFLLNEVALAAMARSREPERQEVAPGLFLGRRPGRRSVPPGDRERWRVLDLTCELPEPAAWRHGSNYRCIPLLDTTAPSVEQLTEGVRYIAAGLEARQRVLVHCALGHGRSALFAAAYLIAVGIAPDAEGAEQHLRHIRGGVKLNAAQRRMLAEYAQAG